MVWINWLRYEINYFSRWSVVLAVTSNYTDGDLVYIEGSDVVYMISYDRVVIDGEISYRLVRPTLSDITTIFVDGNDLISVPDMLDQKIQQMERI